MGKGEMSNSSAEVIDSSTLLAKTTAEASKMLEAALLQMDGIISGACVDGAGGDAEWKDSVKDATRNLIAAIKNAPKLPPPPEPTSVEILLQWMKPVRNDESSFGQGEGARLKQRLVMESAWCPANGERQDLKTILEEEDKGCNKDTQSDTSDAASTVKCWHRRWTPTETCGSSESSSTSDQGEDFPDLCPRNLQTYGFCQSQGCLCQYCLMVHNNRMMALQGSLPNLCAAANIGHFAALPPLYPVSCASMMSDSYHRHSKENLTSCKHMQAACHHTQPCQKDQQVINKDCSFHSVPHRTNSTASLGINTSVKCGSLDRRRRRLRNRVERDQRARSQSELNCCAEKEKPYYCSVQQFQCNSNPYNYCSSTEERLRKLETERGALQMEVSVLSEQVEVQSSKILELENMLQEKKDILRQMEEALQKEILSRSALETQKLELLSSLSEMKLRQASLEHENKSLRNTSPLSNGERFSRHAGQYSSLPRPPTASKKGVAFADEEKTVIETAPVESSPKSLAEVSADDIGKWLSRLGLECYTNDLKKWRATGAKMLDATQHQIDKELDIKNSLHRKKLLYAIECERSNGSGFLGSEKMDNAAVLRWLDDVGLPQHKDAFLNAKVDGRVLHRLTTEDLITLNVFSQLHAASLRRGIQVLRELNFDFDSLERRSVNGDGADGSNVSLWTNHRVMEWLRVVDLAEYAPHMRGSGVHGGLMVYEGRFTSELFATLLSIPPSKTLLRRHLTVNFNEILGREVVQQKRDMESTLGFVPLTLTARIKVPKKSQFTLKRKKSKSEIDYGNLVCPLEGSPPGTPSMSSSTPGSPNLNSPTH